MEERTGSSALDRAYRLIRAHSALTVCLACYAAALVAFFFHALDVNPQYDTQALSSAYDLLRSPGGAWLADRKYPLFYTLPFAALFKLVSLFTGPFSEQTGFLLGRMVTVLFALGTLALTGMLSRKLYGRFDAALLLLTSVLFFTFSTAIRPHVPLAFWTLLAFSCSLRAGRRWTIAAFLSASAAFCTLQSGLLAFLFPVWALRRASGGVDQILQYLIPSLLLCLVLGYPSLFSSVFDPTLGHDEPIRFSVSHGLRVWLRFIGSELFVLAFAAWGWRRWRIPVVRWFIVGYFLLFSFYATADARYFIVTLPFLSLVGAGMIGDRLRAVLAVLVVVVSARFGTLALRPNTFEQVAAFLGPRDGLFGSIGYPEYFYPLPASRVIEKGAFDMMTFVVAPDALNTRADAELEECFRATSSRTTDANVLLWVETPWALWHLLEATALGPNLTVYCKRLAPVPGQTRP
jgi:hypothetical protein